MLPGPLVNELTHRKFITERHRFSGVSRGNVSTETINFFFLLYLLSLAPTNVPLPCSAFRLMIHNVPGKYKHRFEFSICMPTAEAWNQRCWKHLNFMKSEVAIFNAHKRGIFQYAYFYVLLHWLIFHRVYEQKRYLLEVNGGISSRYGVPLDIKRKRMLFLCENTRAGYSWQQSRNKTSLWGWMWYEGSGSYLNASL